MKHILFSLCAVLIGAVMFTADAEAKRLGGGRSVGTQRSAPPPAAAPSQQNSPQAAPAPQQAQPQSGFSRWLPMLGGLAIGGLLGSLFGGSGLGGILLLALIAIGAVMLVKAFARRSQARTEPVQFAGMGRESVRMPAAETTPAGGTAVKQSIPAGFDVAGFTRGAKLNFIKLQAANDAGKLDEIREFTTQEMFDELSRDAAPSGQHTDVVSLDADLLEVVTEGDKHWASVRFSGAVREAPGASVENFQEVWNLVKPTSGSSGWLLAGIQQMQ
jgi:predicted lipid-binding transport protein (Tim44 family)